MTDEREDRLRRLMEATDENTKAKAIDIAMKHYLTDLHNKQEVVTRLPDDLVEELSTPYLPLTREIEHSVGRN
jgi:uncharacterized protein YigA (DUF484 family)